MKQKTNFHQNILQKIIFGGIFLLLSTNISAQENQNLVVSFKDETTQTFPANAVTSIKFESGNMVINQNDGAVFTFSTPEIETYEIVNTLSLNNFENNTNKFKIYPNPSHGMVYIELDPKITDLKKIEIIDVNGRIIEQIYTDKQQANRVFNWNSMAKPGIYYCRIITQKSIISKPIIIN